MSKFKTGRTQGRFRIRYSGLFRMSIFGFLALLLLVGCSILPASPSPERAYVIAAESYATVMETLADYRRAGLIDDDAADHIERHRRVARAALDMWRSALEHDRPADALVDQFYAALGRLIEARRAVEQNETEGLDG